MHIYVRFMWKHIAESSIYLCFLHICMCVLIVYQTLSPALGPGDTIAKNGLCETYIVVGETEN